MLITHLINLHHLYIGWSGSPPDKDFTVYSPLNSWKEIRRPRAEFHDECIVRIQSEFEKIQDLQSHAIEVGKIKSLIQRVKKQETFL